MKETASTPSRKRLLIVVVAILLLVNVALISILIVRLIPKVNRNALAIGKQASQDIVEIQLERPIELNFLSKNEVLQIRKRAVSRYNALLIASYEPVDSVFGQIEDKLPWWGMKGQFYFGSGNRSIEGPAEESRFLVNPYLLVAADFFGLTLQSTPGWNQSAISEAMLDQPNFPLVCLPHTLHWYPRQAKAEATYNVSQCKDQMSRWATQPLTLKDMHFDLIAYNARDMNMNYMAVAFDQSDSIDQYNRFDGVFAISHFLHRGGSCGYPGGCNNMSPDTPQISYYDITGLPAWIYIKLWKDAPSSPTNNADMVFIIHFE